MDDNSPVGFDRFIDRFARLLGRPFRPFHLPRALVLPGVITHDQKRVLDLATTMDSSRIRTELGWLPRFRSYEEGLTDAVKHARF